MSFIFRGRKKRTLFFFGTGLYLHNIALILTYAYVFLLGLGVENNLALSYLVSHLGFIGASVLTNAVILGVFVSSIYLDTHFDRIFKRQGLLSLTIALALFLFMQFDVIHDLGVMFGVV